MCSDIEGYREVVTPETALTVPPEDPAALVAAVEALLADEPRRVAMGAAAREHAVANYSWEDIARRLEAVYERVTARAREPVVA